jgi:hypothetical protein
MSFEKRSPVFQKPERAPKRRHFKLIHAIGAGAVLVTTFACAPVTGRRAATAETVFVAPGVDLVLRDSAGPEARRIADAIQRIYGAELITARSPVEAPSNY